MHFLSDYHKDVRTPKEGPGAYEWWYFDGIDNTGTYSFVIIFYEGNPFSTRYIQRQQQNSSGRPLPQEHPAASISIYKNQEPIYYSFTEFGQHDSQFDAGHPRLHVGEHSMVSRIESNKLIYELNLEEELPSGDALRGTITFCSPPSSNALMGGVSDSTEDGHWWNLVQPRAEFTADLDISSMKGRYERVQFEGQGYHDHNTGSEPMRNEFKEWYWGRFHFKVGTLVYYMMERKNEKQCQAWLISPDNAKLLATFPDVDLRDKGLNLFGIKSARTIILSNEKAHVTIQQTQVLDNGPFYQRFQSDAFINLPAWDSMQASTGITEYLRPDRIYWRMFWPLVNMRIRYKREDPHWVQRSGRLYRWTW